MINDDQAQALKVERVCPRCHAHRLHFARQIKVKRKGSDPDHPTFRIAIRICCAECSHDWRGRFKKDEWNQETSIGS